MCDSKTAINQFDGNPSALGAVDAGDAHYEY
jgi:hypothetical protein